MVFTNYADEKSITRSTFCATNDTNCHPGGIDSVELEVRAIRRRLRL